MSKLLLIFSGLFFAALVPVWIFFIAPEFLEMPTSYSAKANMIHTENNRFDLKSDWGGKAIALSSSSIKSVSTKGETITLGSMFKVESLTGEVLFELNQSFLVDKETRHNLPGGNDKDGSASTLFPPDFSKKTINFWPIEMGAPTVLTYFGVKDINGLSTTHFRARDAVIDDTLGYEFLPLVPEKYRALSRITIDVYIDPITGSIIDYQDAGTSYYADSEGKEVWDIAEWSNKYNDLTIGARVTKAKSQRTSILLVDRVVPISFAVLGLLLILIGIFKKSQQKQSKK